MCPKVVWLKRSRSRHETPALLKKNDLWIFNWAFEVLMLFTRNAYQWSFSLEVDKHWQCPVSDIHLPLSKTLWPIRIRFTLSFLHSLFPIGWKYCLFEFPKSTGDAPDIIGKQLLLQFLLSKDNKRNPPVLVWWKEQHQLSSYDI